MKKQKRKLLFINAHPDDDSLIAGTMISLVKQGYSVMEYVCTDGGAANPASGENQKSIVTNRKKETELFNTLVGSEKPRIYPTNGKRLVYNDEILFDMVKVLREFRPDIIVLHNKADYHFEHIRSHEIGLLAIENAFRSTLPELGKKLTEGIVLETDGLNVLANPLIVFDTSNVQKEKNKIVAKAYGKRLDAYGLRFDQGLAMMRGGRIGTEYGEAYKLLNPNWYRMNAKSAQILANFVEAGTKK